MARISDYDINRTISANVVSTERITPESDSEEVRRLQLDIEAEEFTFELGQSICVIVPGPHELGNADHVRFYSIAGLSGTDSGGGARLELCVKRCSYVDEFSGERYQGVASNFLCDLKPGDTLRIAGPFGLPFNVPNDSNANMLMIGMGTGVAPFRAFTTKIHREMREWQGRVRIFYGAKTGLELTYMNDHVKDLANYYQEETFKAFSAISQRPHLGEPAGVGQSIEENSKEVMELLGDSNTYVYVAGVEKLSEILDETLAKMFGGKDAWQKKKIELSDSGRWQEIIY